MPDDEAFNLVQIWHLKLPAYVNIESRPYDPDFYRAHLEDISIDGKAEPLLARSKMIGVRNTIRWKWVTGGDGEPVGLPFFAKLMERHGEAMRECSVGQMAQYLCSLVPTYSTLPHLKALLSLDLLILNQPRQPVLPNSPKLPVRIRPLRSCV